ncbi:hypothetical protein MNEG_10621, partial [Monoraphidium neglectum]
MCACDALLGFGGSAQGDMDSAGCLPPKTIDSSDSDSAASSLGGGSSTEDVDPGAAASSWWSTPSFYPQQPRQQAPTRTGMGGL